jgi:hypothetical protein
MTSGFQDIPGYEGLYEIDCAGVIKSYPRNGTKGGYLKPDIVCGYEQVTLYKNNNPKRYKVHRLVLSTFCIGSDTLPVNHKNGNKVDNRLENLEYVTCKQNTEHARRLFGNWNLKGQDHPMSKITRKDVTEIIRLCKTHKQREIANRYELSEAQISRIVSRKRWNK